MEATAVRAITSARSGRLAIVGGVSGGRWRAPCAAVIAACAACGGAWAQSGVDALQPLVLAQEPSGGPVAQPERWPRLEVNATNPPRMDSADGGWGGPRVTMSLLPQGTASAIGPTVGMSNLSPQAGTLPGSNGFASAQPAVDLGVHWRHVLDSRQRIDVTASRRMGAGPETPVAAMAQPATYRAAIELNLSKPASASSGFVTERGSVGFQLEGGGRLMFKARGGRPMIYYRNQF